MKKLIRNFGQAVRAAAISSLLITGTTYADINAGPAPDFTLKNESGSNLRLNEFRDEVVMINF